MKVLFLLIITTYVTAYDYDYYDDYYDYYYDYDPEFFLDYMSCEEDEFCVYKETWVAPSKESQVGNSSIGMCFSFILCNPHYQNSHGSYILSSLCKYPQIYPPNLYFNSSPKIHSHNKTYFKHYFI